MSTVVNWLMISCDSTSTILMTMTMLISIEDPSSILKDQLLKALVNKISMRAFEL